MAVARDLKERRPAVDLFKRRSLAAIVREALNSLGGRAETATVVAAVRSMMTVDEHSTWSDSALYQAVKNAARQGVSSHEEATYVINGEIVQESLFDRDDYVHVARVLARQGHSKFAAVHRLAQRCEERLGETFDADSLISEEQGA